MSPVFFTDRDLGARFPEILRSAGLTVERHDDLFGPTTPDPIWLARAGRERWLVLTRDHRIRYRPNELGAVMENLVRLFVLVGLAKHEDLARNVVNTAGRIEAFAGRNAPPFIAKVYRPTAEELVHRPAAPGRVDLWLSGKDWRRPRPS